MHGGILAHCGPRLSRILSGPIPALLALAHIFGARRKTLTQRHGACRLKHEYMPGFLKQPVAIEHKHMRAAKRLAEQVVREHAQLMKFVKQLHEFIGEWESSMIEFRKMERVTMIEREPTEGERTMHLDVINAMILGADTISGTCERHLEINYHLGASERESLLGKIALIKSHRAILAFEYRDWTPSMSKDELHAALKTFGERASKAA